MRFTLGNKRLDERSKRGQAMAFAESSFNSGRWGRTTPWRQPEVGLQRAVA
jgi:hypothetical protein